MKKSVVVLLVVIGGAILLPMVVWPDLFPSWFGLDEITNDSGEMVRAQKSLWDLAELLIVPLFLAGGAAWIAHSQQKRELEEREVDRDIAEQARDTDRDIAEKARNTDREIAKDRQEQATIENYYDRMAELLLAHKLRTKIDDNDNNDEERSIARARTLTVLRSLNAARKGHVLQFLYESKLIDSPNPVIVLSGADLRGADLSGATLNKADLNKADLRGADLSGATLNEADLNEADLRGATLNGAALNEADLSWANLNEAALNKAILEDAKMEGVKLSEADLRGATLSDTRLNKANLSGTDLRGAWLLWTNLGRANLSDAILADADLRGADLSGATLIRTKYNKLTQWPEDFNPKAAGATLVDDAGNPIEDLGTNND